MDECGSDKIDDREDRIRIGYLVPGFPGQTHIFFWREVQALRELGVTVELVSTRPPDSRIQPHVWTEDAILETTYLFPLRLPELFNSLLYLFRAGWRRWIAIYPDVFRSGPYRVLRNLGLLLLAAKLATLSERKNWSHIHVHSCGDSAFIAGFAARLSNVTYSLTLHGPVSDYGPGQDFKWSGARFAIVITDKLYREVRAELGTALPARVDIAPMGVDLRRIKRKAPYSSWSGQGALNLVSCGRLNRVKGHEELINAVALLRNKGFDVRLKICGQDELGGDGYARELFKLISRLNLDGVVTLLGAVSEDQVLTELEAAHVFVLASYHEPLGVAYMEAMAMNLPTIGTDAGGVRELIEHDIDGILVPPRDSLELALAIEKLFFDVPRAERIAAAGREKIRNKFDSRISAEVIYRRVMETSG